MYIVIDSRIILTFFACISCPNCDINVCMVVAVIFTLLLKLKTAKLKRAAVRWSHANCAASGAHLGYLTWFSSC